MLACGTPADSLDENLKIGKSTTLESLGLFARGVIETFGPEFLHSPIVEVTRLSLRKQSAYYNSLRLRAFSVC
jgi:hypothetical protein